MSPTDLRAFSHETFEVMDDLAGRMYKGRQSIEIPRGCRGIVQRHIVKFDPCLPLDIAMKFATKVILSAPRGTWTPSTLFSFFALRRLLRRRSSSPLSTKLLLTL